MNFNHPREHALLQFAAGSAPEPDRRQVTDHLAACTRCRTTVTLSREVIDYLHATPAPAPDALLQRALASRAAETLVILPLSDDPRGYERSGTETWKKVVLGLGVAALVTVVVLPHAAPGVATGLGLLPAVIPSVDRVPPAGPIDPSRLHPLDLWYRVETVGQNGNPPDRTLWHYRVQPAAGTAGDWLIITDAGHGNNRDSLIVDGTTLRPKSFATSMGSHHVAYRIDHSVFTDSTVVTSYFYPHGDGPSDPKRPKDHVVSRPFAHPVPGTQYYSDANLFLLLMAIPFSDSWEGTVSRIVQGNGATHDTRQLRVRKPAWGRKHPDYFEIQWTAGPPAGRNDLYRVRASDGVLLKYLLRYGGDTYESMTLISEKPWPSGSPSAGNQ